MPAASDTTIGISVTPYYDPNGPHVEVGKFSKGLEEATASSIGDLTKRMKEEWDTLPAEAMYVLSIRLYDFGLKDDATYWFYSAQYRHRLLDDLLEPKSIGSMGAPAFELGHALGAFFELAGPYINGHAAGDVAGLCKIMRRVKSENESIPAFRSIYSNLKFIPDESWPEKNKKAAAGLQKLIDYNVTTAAEIKAKRKAMGIEGKY